MRIDLVTLCDAAVEINGRLHVLGSIDYFWAAALPYLHPKCALAVRFRWNDHQPAQTHRVKVQVLDGDGYMIASEFEQEFTPPRVRGDDVPLVRHLILELNSLRFASFGPYAARVEVDGEELASLPFSIVRLKQVHQQRAGG